MRRRSIVMVGVAAWMTVVGGTALAAPSTPAVTGPLQVQPADPPHARLGDHARVVVARPVTPNPLDHVAVVTR